MAGNRSASLGRKTKCDGKAWVSKSSEDRWKWKCVRKQNTIHSLWAVWCCNLEWLSGHFFKTIFPLDIDIRITINN